MRAYIKREDHKYDYPDQMEQILKYLREHGVLNVSGATVEALYYQFSADRFCAGWVIVDEAILEEFADWLSGIDI